MLNKCVLVCCCGIFVLGWLLGGYFKVVDGVVLRLVCFNWGFDCCIWCLSILVWNCGGFYVYKLKNVFVCKLCYCGVGEYWGKFCF